MILIVSGYFNVFGMTTNKNEIKISFRIVLGSYFANQNQGLMLVDRKLVEVPQ